MKISITSWCRVENSTMIVIKDYHANNNIDNINNNNNNHNHNHKDDNYYLNGKLRIKNLLKYVISHYQLSFYIQHLLIIMDII